METVEYKNISFTVWDVGGQDKVRPVAVIKTTSATCYVAWPCPGCS